MGDNDRFCKDCVCEKGKEPCIVCCTGRAFDCSGTCSCCEDHRRRETQKESDNYTAKDVQVATGEDSPNLKANVSERDEEGLNLEAEDRFCKDCVCEKGKEPCMVCCKGRAFDCSGTCTCCEDHRRRKAQKESGSSTAKDAPVATGDDSPDLKANESKKRDEGLKLEAEERFCEKCACERDQEPCLICSNDMEFDCSGTCTCCEAHRSQKALKISEEYASTDAPLATGDDILNLKAKLSEDTDVEKLNLDLGRNLNLEPNAAEETSDDSMSIKVQEHTVKQISVIRFSDLPIKDDEMGSPSVTTPHCENTENVVEDLKNAAEETSDDSMTAKVEHTLQPISVIRFSDLTIKDEEIGSRSVSTHCENTENVVEDLKEHTVKQISVIRFSDLPIKDEEMGSPSVTTPHCENTENVVEDLKICPVKNKETSLKAEDEGSSSDTGESLN